MSGFLTRQAMRVLNPGYGVRPRVPARFEPFGHAAGEFGESSVERVNGPPVRTGESTWVEDQEADYGPTSNDASVLARSSQPLPTILQPVGTDEPHPWVEAEVSPAQPPAVPVIDPPPHLRTQPQAQPPAKTIGPTVSWPIDVVDPARSPTSIGDPASQPTSAVPPARPPIDDPTGVPDSPVPTADPISAEPTGHVLRAPDGPAGGHPQGTVHRSVEQATTEPKPTAVASNATARVATSSGHPQSAAGRTVDPQSDAQQASPSLPDTVTGRRPPAAGEADALDLVAERAFSTSADIVSGHRSAATGQPAPRDFDAQQSLLEPPEPPSGRRPSTARLPTSHDRNERPASSTTHDPVSSAPGQFVARPGVARLASHVSVSSISTGSISTGPTGPATALPRRTRRQPAAETEPSVQVTIGSVEVTAVPPPPPASVVNRPKARTQTMTLSDYLRKRRGGDRR